MGAIHYFYSLTLSNKIQTTAALAFLILLFYFPFIFFIAHFFYFANLKCKRKVKVCENKENESKIQNTPSLTLSNTCKQTWTHNEMKINQFSIVCVSVCYALIS